MEELRAELASAFVAGEPSEIGGIPKIIVSIARCSNSTCALVGSGAEHNAAPTSTSSP